MHNAISVLAASHSPKCPKHADLRPSPISAAPSRPIAIFSLPLSARKTHAPSLCEVTDFTASQWRRPPLSLACSEVHISLRPCLKSEAHVAPLMHATRCQRNQPPRPPKRALSPLPLHSTSALSVSSPRHSANSRLPPAIASELASDVPCAPWFFFSRTAL